MKQDLIHKVARNKRRQKAREAILKAAAYNFAAYGFAGARMDKIAIDASVNKAMLYYHIGDKSELYKQALKRVAGEIADQVLANIPKTENPEQAFKIYVSTIVKNIFSSKFLTPIILRELADKGKNMPDEVIEQIARIISVLRSILDKGEREGVFRKVNLPLLQMLIAGGVNFIAAGRPTMKKAVKLMASAHNQPKNETPEEISEFISGILVNGLKTRQG
ncbi:MAG TPA: TetR/AcrR family transcriptional regulator [Nitrospirae bacterium]|nr:TetR/AcrR family transcriptional regulator [Nitrospirota bacterium]